MERYDAGFMDIAWKAAQLSNCRRRKVGVVVVLNGVVVITGTNGTPAGMIPCNEGGCPRCFSDTPSGELYDSCLCIHAEQLAIAIAARKGLEIDGATLYCTLRPCLTCVVLCLEAGIFQIIYEEHIDFRGSVEEAYGKLTSMTPLNLARYNKGK